MKPPSSQRMHCCSGLVLALAGGLFLLGSAPGTDSRPEPLQLYVHLAGDEGFSVAATLIYGRTEAVLIDAQFRMSDAQELANHIASTGRALKAIFITHPDDDHYLGTAALHRRFPQTPIYMSQAGLDEFKRTAAESLAAQKQRAPSETPASLPTPAILPGAKLVIDGQEIEIVKDLQGDYPSPPSNSMIWIPSLRTVIAGDIVFSGIHPWLAGSTPETRAAWRRSLERIVSMHPLRVVPGHVRNPDLGNGLDALSFMTRYLDAFGNFRKSEPDADAFIAAMTRRFPDLGEEKFLVIAAKASYGTSPVH